MRKICTSLLVAVCLAAFISVPAFAGDKQRHRWEGAAIGVGAAIIGHALISDCKDKSPDRVVVIREKDRHHHERNAHHHDRGRGKGRKVWVAPEYERVWNPGHYNRHGDWVGGRWITIETQPGHWAKKDKRRACR